MQNSSRKMLICSMQIYDEQELHLLLLVANEI